MLAGGGGGAPHKGSTKPAAVGWFLQPCVLLLTQALSKLNNHMAGGSGRPALTLTKIYFTLLQRGAVEPNLGFWANLEERRVFFQVFPKKSFPVLFLSKLWSPQKGGGGVKRGINGRYQFTECPCHRQSPPLVRKFSHCAHCVPFLVGVLHYRKYRERAGWYVR